MGALFWRFEMTDNRKKQMMEIAHSQGWDMSAMVLAREISDFLDSIKDEGTSIDSGGCHGGADLWPKIGGVEFYINIRRSNNQIKKDNEEDQHTPGQGP